ncbi:hypothetical protein HPP92_020919 [Vanilla planifolia]|uniref:Uncharacterized protein n=1 Tax=Vanilla planifolia TaxID=51239 RepID=A0A835UIA6_VANPL|nr:hypothetical protein HPP92_020919 [Vanilla planifolia]
MQFSFPRKTDNSMESILFTSRGRGEAKGFIIYFLTAASIVVSVACILSKEPSAADIDYGRHSTQIALPQPSSLAEVGTELADCVGHRHRLLWLCIRNCGRRRWWWLVRSDA